MTIEPKIAKYVDTRIDHAIERERKIFNTDMKIYVDRISNENRGYMEALKEAFHNEVQTVVELIQDRPTRDEVRAIAREEIDESLRPVNAKLDFLNEERKEMIHALREIKA